MHPILRIIIPPSIRELLGAYSYLKQQGALARGHARGVGTLMRWGLHALRGKEIHFTTPDGTRFVSMPNNFSSVVVAFLDYRDPAIQKFMERRLRVGFVFVDAGANIGTYTVRASRLVGSQGKVIAVEAHPLTYGYLTRNIALNHLANVTPMPVALGDRQGDILLSFNEMNAGETHIARPTEKSVSVPLTTLDTLLESAAVSRVNYLKIDVEGFEFPLLLGSRRTITDNPDIVVQTELIDKHAARYGFAIHQITEFFTDLGLTPHTVDASGTPVAASLAQRGDTDILWYRESKV